MRGMDRGMLSDISANSTVAIFIVTESGCWPELSYRSDSVWRVERDWLVWTEEDHCANPYGRSTVLIKKR